MKLGVDLRKQLIANRIVPLLQIFQQACHTLARTGGASWHDYSQGPTEIGQVRRLLSCRESKDFFCARDKM